METMQPTLKAATAQERTLATFTIRLLPERRIEFVPTRQVNSAAVAGRVRDTMIEAPSGNLIIASPLATRTLSS